MNCIYNKNGFCEKLSDSTVKQPCIESPCNNDISNEDYENAITGYCIDCPQTPIKDIEEIVYNQSKEVILQLAENGRNYLNSVMETLKII